MLWDWLSKYLKPSKNQTKCILDFNFLAVFESSPMRSLVVTMKKLTFHRALPLALSFLCGSLLNTSLVD